MSRTITWIPTALASGQTLQRLEALMTIQERCLTTIDLAGFWPDDLAGQEARMEAMDGANESGSLFHWAIDAAREMPPHIHAQAAASIVIEAWRQDLEEPKDPEQVRRYRYHLARARRGRQSRNFLDWLEEISLAEVLTNNVAQLWQTWLRQQVEEVA